jgi:cell division protein FtsB
MIKVEGHKNLYRDNETGAIINCDYQEYSNYVSQKKEREKLKSEVQNLKSEFDRTRDLVQDMVSHFSPIFF